MSSKRAAEWSSAPIDATAIVDGMNVRDSRVHNYPPRWNAAPSQDPFERGITGTDSPYKRGQSGEQVKMATKVEVADHWTDTGRKQFLAEVRVTTDQLRDFPRLMIEVPDQGSLEANVQEARRSLQRFVREIEKALQSPLRLSRDRSMR